MAYFSNPGLCTSKAFSFFFHLYFDVYLFIFLNIIVICSRSRFELDQMGFDGMDLERPVLCVSTLTLCGVYAALWILGMAFGAMVPGGIESRQSRLSVVQV